MVPFYQNARYHIPEKNNLHIHDRENFGSLLQVLFVPLKHETEFHTHPKEI